MNKNKTTLEKELTLKILSTISDDVVLSIGNKGDFTKKQMIDEINNNSQTGMEIIETQLALLRSFKDGSFAKLMTTI